MLKLIWGLLVIHFSGLTQSRSYFNTIPDVGGINGQAMCFIVLPQANTIKFWAIDLTQFCQGPIPSHG